MSEADIVVGNLGMFQVMTTLAAEAGGPEAWIEGLRRDAVKDAVARWGWPAAAALLVAGTGLGAVTARVSRPRRSPEPDAPAALTNLGPYLAALTRSDDDLDCLEVFAELVASGSAVPTFLGVVVTPDGARILTIGNPSPGLTIQVDDQLDLDVTRLWFGDEGPGAPLSSP